MNDKNCLVDGQYSADATLHIKDGKAVVVLHSMFGLASGTEIPLKRREGKLLVEGGITKEPGILNGHSII